MSLSVASAEEDGQGHLISEDMDFFEPSAKGKAGQREKLLDGRQVGSVQKYLRRTHNVYVKSLVLFENSSR